MHKKRYGVPLATALFAIAMVPAFASWSPEGDEHGRTTAAASLGITAGAAVTAVAGGSLVAGAIVGGMAGAAFATFTTLTLPSPLHPVWQAAIQWDAPLPAPSTVESGPDRLAPPVAFFRPVERHTPG